MRKAVIDASVVLKWIPGKNEKYVEEARELYRLLLANKVKLWAPDFLLVEVLNILVKKRRVDPKKAWKGVERIAECGIEFLALPIKDAGSLIQFMGEYGVTAYDALYLRLAQKLETKLVTYDEKLTDIRKLAVTVRQLIAVNS